MVSRVPLTDLEYAKGLKKLLDAGWRVQDLSKLVGRTPDWILQKLATIAPTDTPSLMADEPLFITPAQPAREGK